MTHLSFRLIKYIVKGYGKEAFEKIYPFSAEYVLALS